MEDKFRFDDFDDFFDDDGGGKPERKKALPFSIEWSNEESEDVLMRMQNPKTGQEVTFVTAPASLFGEDELGPIVTALQDQVIVAFNSDRLDVLIDEAIRNNGETFGVQAAAMLPISLVISLGMQAAEEHLNIQE